MAVIDLGYNEASSAGSDQISLTTIADAPAGSFVLVFAGFTNTGLGGTPTCTGGVAYTLRGSAVGSKTRCFGFNTAVLGSDLVAGEVLTVDFGTVSGWDATVKMCIQAVAITDSLSQFEFVNDPGHGGNAISWAFAEIVFFSPSTVGPNASGPINPPPAGPYFLIGGNMIGLTGSGNGGAVSFTYDGTVTAVRNDDLSTGWKTSSAVNPTTIAVHGTFTFTLPSGGGNAEEAWVLFAYYPPAAGKDISKDIAPWGTKNLAYAIGGGLSLRRYNNDWPRSVIATLEHVAAGGGVEGVDILARPSTGADDGIWDLLYCQSNDVKQSVSRDDGKTWSAGVSISIAGNNVRSVIDKEAGLKYVFVWRDSDDKIYLTVGEMQSTGLWGSWSTEVVVATGVTERGMDVTLEESGIIELSYNNGASITELVWRGVSADGALIA